jgi:hypothetical protein
MQGKRYFSLTLDLLNFFREVQLKVRLDGVSMNYSIEIGKGGLSYLESRTEYNCM